MIRKTRVIFWQALAVFFFTGSIDGAHGTGTMDGTGGGHTVEIVPEQVIAESSVEHDIAELPAGRQKLRSEEHRTVRNRLPVTQNKAVQSDKKQDATRHRLIVVADPQVYFESELDSVRRAAADIKRTASDGIPTVGVVVGDMVGDITSGPSLSAVKEALESSGVEFRYVLGNHDLDVDARSNGDPAARRSFNAVFGPSYYSFDLGRVHYVVLDDVFMLARGVARYVGYIDEEQLQWLERDLAKVRAGSTVVVCLHIPTWSKAAERKAWGEEQPNKIVNNREALYRLLAPYDAHIMSGHEHYLANYSPAPNIREHVHAPLSTYFWQTPASMDGVPAGYAVYEFEGDSVSWYYKAVDLDRSRQFTAYGVGQNRDKPEAVTVNVWNVDEDWSVRWWENGEARGPMTRYTGIDEALVRYVENHRDEIIYPWLGAVPTDHLFYAVPEAPDAHIRIEACDGFGNVYSWDNTTGYGRSEK